MRYFLEMKSGGFVAVDELLASPELQEQCAEKAVLTRIKKRLRKEGLALVRVKDEVVAVPVLKLGSSPDVLGLNGGANDE